MFEKFTRIWRLKDLRKSILFVLGMLIVFRIGAHVPIPGIDVAALRQLFQSNQFLGLVNIFSGGSLESFSILMLGVAPYITASIILQLLSMVIPKLEELAKEPGGQEKINAWTRYLTVPLAVLQAYGTISLLRQSGQNILGTVDPWRLTTMLITITAGTVFLMWIGELMTEKKVGNGISLIIFAGIVSSLPKSIQQTILTFDPSQIPNIVLFIALAIITIVGVVMITEAQRNVPVQYARQVRGMRMFGGTSTHLPLRVNMAGVIPIIFAISLILFPPLVAQFLLRVQVGWIQTVANWVIVTFQNQLFYGVMYFVLVFAFTYFYTAVVFHPNRIAESLQKQGGFIPGIRPGQQTEQYLLYVTNRIMLAGALFLGVIAVLPLVVQQFTGTQALVVGGTSLLIVVSVAIETVKQVDAQLQMREYEGL